MGQRRVPTEFCSRLCSGPGHSFARCPSAPQPTPASPGTQRTVCGRERRLGAGPDPLLPPPGLPRQPRPPPGRWRPQRRSGPLPPTLAGPMVLGVGVGRRGPWGRCWRHSGGGHGDGEDPRVPRPGAEDEGEQRPPGFCGTTMLQQ